MSVMPIDRDKKFRDIAKRFGISGGEEESLPESKPISLEKALETLLPGAPQVSLPTKKTSRKGKV